MMRLLAFTVCLLVTASAHGQDAAVRLAWRVPAEQGCPTDAQIRASVEERLGRRVFERIDDGSAFTVRGSIEPAEEPGSWRARVALVAPDGEMLGERIVVASDPACDALRGPLAIIVSLLVEQHRERIVLYEPPREVVRPVAVEQTVLRPSEPTESSSGVTFGFQIGATLRGLALPGPAFGLRQVLRFGWEGVPFAVGLEAQIAPPFTYSIDAAASELWFWSAGATLCPVLFEEPAVRSVTCAGVVLGQSHARGVGLDVLRSNEALRVDVVTRFGVSIRLLGPLRVVVAAMLDVPVVQQVFTYGPAMSEQILFEGLPVSLGLSVALGLFWPDP